MSPCNFCKTPLIHEFANLGLSPVSNRFVLKEDSPETFYPLDVAVCEKCFLVQLKYTQDRTLHFNEEYLYFSSYSSSWLSHAQEYVKGITNRLALNKNSQVIEIASNDGYLLQYFEGPKVLGIEPSESVAKAARVKGIETICDFFGASLAKKLPKADLICGANVLAHVPDINDFVQGIKMALKKTGTFTMEFPHLLNLMKNNQFDTIYHEHYSYISLLAAEKIFQAHGLKICDAEELETHGGSLRVYGTHLDNKVHESQNLQKIRRDEADFGLHNIPRYKQFSAQAKTIKRDLLSLLIKLKKDGKRIAAYGAAAKGNTLLNFCGIGRDFIEYVVDKNPNKQGKFLPGSHIPVLDTDALEKSPVDYIVILPWNLKKEITEQLGPDNRYIVPIPRPEII